MKPGCFPFWLVGLLLFFLSTDSQTSEYASFNFNPPEVKFTESLEMRRTTISAGIDPVEEITTQTISHSINKTGSGYKWISEPIKTRITRGDKSVEDPVASTLNSAVITYHISPAGKLLNIEGYGGILEAVKKSTPKSMASTLNALLNEQVLIEKERAQWNVRIGDVIGKPLDGSTAWLSEGNYPLPDGSKARFYVVSFYAGPVNEPNKGLARIKYLFTSESDKIPRLLNDLARDQIKGPLAPKLPTSEIFKISGTGERILDPSTMLVYSEKYDRTIEVKLASEKARQLYLVIQESRQSKSDFALDQ